MSFNDKLHKIIKLKNVKYLYYVTIFVVWQWQAKCLQ